MAATADMRNIRTGFEIPSEGYCDQPYILRTDDGAWLCVLTTGTGREGQHGQHVVTARSTDFGKTWSELVDVEPADGPEASYAVLLKAPGGRIYCFYNHNTDNIRWVAAANPPFKDGKCYRVDSLGYHVFKYSDDHGRSWSSERVSIPIREMDIDRRNNYGGEIQFFWNVGKPFVLNGSAYISVHKVGGFGNGFFTRSEGVLVRSPNLLTVGDPAAAEWETLPDGDFGLRTPSGGGSIAEEQSYSVLSDGSLYCVYRTVDGHPCSCYSRDGGHTWTEPAYKTYADGREMKHPRAANFAWKCRNGKFLYWFHNHGGKGYDDRNPVWFCGGVEADSADGKVIRWSQPEIVLYDDDPYIRMSYPDLVEEDGRYFVTETQKEVARVHELDPQLIAGLWAQFDNSAVAGGAVLELSGDGGNMPEAVPMPAIKPFSSRDNSRFDHGLKNLCTGLSVELVLLLTSTDPGQVILDARTVSGQGIAMVTTERATLELILNDGRAESRWDCDPGLLEAGKAHHVVVTVDGGPRIITFVVDGRLCDGGTSRQFGWGRFSATLMNVTGADELRILPQGAGSVALLRLYDRFLTTSESVGNYRAWTHGNANND